MINKKYTINIAISVSNKNTFEVPRDCNIESIRLL